MDEPQREDYVRRATEALKRISVVLKELELDIGAEIDVSKFPKMIRPMPVFLDTKKYEEEAVKKEEKEPIVSPIQIEKQD